MGCVARTNVSTARPAGDIEHGTDAGGHVIRGTPCRPPGGPVTGVGSAGGVRRCWVVMVVVGVVVDEEEVAADVEQAAPVGLAGGGPGPARRTAGPAAIDPPGEQHDVVAVGGVGRDRGWRRSPMRPAARSCARTVRICSVDATSSPAVGSSSSSDVGLLGEALGDERPLALAARQLAEVAVGERAELDPVDGLVDGGAVLAPQPADGPRTGARPRATTSRTVTGRWAGRAGPAARRRCAGGPRPAGADRR